MGIVIKLERIKKGLSQWNLSEKTGLRNYRNSLIECGRVQPTDVELRLIAGALGITISEISADENSEPI